MSGQKHNVRAGWGVVGTSGTFLCSTSDNFQLLTSSRGNILDNALGDALPKKLLQQTVDN